MALPPAQPDEDAHDSLDELGLPPGTAEADTPQELDEMIDLLRSMVPASNMECGRPLIDLARDVSQYIGRIENEINELRTEVQTYAFGNTSSRNDVADCKCQDRQDSAQIQVNATQIEGGIKIYARCRSHQGIMKAAVDALKALDLLLVNASVKRCSCNHMILDAVGVQEGRVLPPEDVERCLIGTLSRHVTEGDACSISATQGDDVMAFFQGPPDDFYV